MSYPFLNQLPNTVIRPTVNDGGIQGPPKPNNDGGPGTVPSYTYPNGFQITYYPNATITFDPNSGWQRWNPDGSLNPLPVFPRR